VDLPDLNGLDLQQRVSDRGELPIIFITGDTGVQTIVKAMKAGALEYLTKPFRTEVLLAAIQLCLGTQSGGTQLRGRSAHRAAILCLRQRS